MLITKTLLVMGVGVMSIIRLRNKTKYQPFKTIILVDCIVINVKVRY